jgi:hypothetical protein
VGKLRSIKGGKRNGYTAQLMAREPGWEVRQIFGHDGQLSGDLIILYTPALVRAIVLLRAVPPESEWEKLDLWVLEQIDNYDRRFVIDYYEGRYVTGVEGPPERTLEAMDEDEE